MRDGRCITGHITSFDDKYVMVGFSKLDRKDVVRVGDGTSLADHDVIYSGRNLWSDVRQAEPNKYEHIELELKNNVRRKCRKFTAMEEEVICDGTQIGKSEIVRGYYVRLAPASEWEHRVARENVTFLAPRTWFDLSLFPRIKVLLYVDALPEENTGVRCKVP